jgi:phage portal protein BeeE
LNNIEQQNQQYIDSALAPIAESICELFDAHLLFEEERARLNCMMDFTDMTRGDTLTRYQGYQIGTLNGWLSRNEVRAKENMDPIDDPSGDEYRVPLNTVDPSRQPAPAGAGGASPGGPNANSEPNAVQAVKP